MSYSVRTVQSAIISILQGNNTTTALSLGLSTTVNTITAGNPEIKPVPINQYPIIFVDIEGGPSEELASLGRNAARNIQQSYKIYAVTHNQDKSTEQSLILRDNIATVLRNYVDLSSTCAWSSLVSGQNSFAQTDSTYVHTAELVLQANHVAVT